MMEQYQQLNRIKALSERVDDWNQAAKISDERFVAMVDQAPVVMVPFSGPHLVITLANERMLESRQPIVHAHFIYAVSCH